MSESETELPESPEPTISTETSTTPETTEAIATTEAPETTATTEAPETTATTEAPKTPEATEAPKTPEATEAPKTPEATEAPKTPEATKTPEAPKSSKPPKSAQDSNSPELPKFSELGLPENVLKGLESVGYERPSPIQAKIIPFMMEGRDVLGQAQTGTGKTAAFALPILAKIDLEKREPQALVLAPTRELAIQVAEAFHTYATATKGFNVLPVYGGADYTGQLRQLKRGVHVVVGTPGRVMDHMRRGSLKLEGLQTLVLDEADEMLRMGFIDDVQWILDQTPEERQIALFSATMPETIRRIATKHQNNPEHIKIKVKTATAETIRQRFWMVSGLHKLDALTRILEAEKFDAMIVFVRTKTATLELAEKLEARGFSSAALNGDVSQNVRERTVERLKSGELDILVATDVAARGLDVERISHVINYDIPYDTEAYIHRIGRTGRAGRTGEAILFCAPREKRMLYSIEKATRQKIEMMQLPSTEVINDIRVERFKQRITDVLAQEEIGFYYQLLEAYRQEHNKPALEIAAALARLVQGEEPLLLKEKTRQQIREEEQRERDARGGRDRGGRERGGRERGGRERGGRERGGRDRGPREDRPPRERRPAGRPESGMERYRIDVGRSDGVQPGNIVGAITNEAGLDGEYIGRINIHDGYSTIDLPEGMPKPIFSALKKARVSGKPMNITRDTGENPEGDEGGGNRGSYSKKPRRDH